MRAYRLGLVWSLRILAIPSLVLGISSAALLVTTMTQMMHVDVALTLSGWLRELVIMAGAPFGFAVIMLAVAECLAALLRRP